MQFLQTNNYFKKMGTITCLTLLSNCEVKRVIRGQKVGSLSSQMEEVCFVRRGEVEVHKRALVQEGVRDQMVAMTVGGG
jgi:signal-transduction protein with cAMP-binding, CBS, and nucleotidyltransferase domain